MSQSTARDFLARLEAVARYAPKWSRLYAQRARIVSAHAPGYSKHPRFQAMRRTYRCVLESASERFYDNSAAGSTGPKPVGFDHSSGNAGRGSPGDVQKMVETGYPSLHQELSLMRKDGSRHIGLFKPYDRLMSGLCAGVVLSRWDLTERKRTEECLGKVEWRQPNCPLSDHRLYFCRGCPIEWELKFPMGIR